MAASSVKTNLKECLYFPYYSDVGRYSYKPNGCMSVTREVKDSANVGASKTDLANCARMLQYGCKHFESYSP